MVNEEEVDRIIAEVRKMDPDHIFVKDRGFPPEIPAAAGRISEVHARDTMEWSTR